jgi:hypothetical protein
MTNKKKDEIMREEREMEERKKKERIGYWGYTEASFSKHLIPLERYRWHDFNYTFKKTLNEIVINLKLTQKKPW